MSLSASAAALGDVYTTIEVSRLLGMAVRSVQLMVDRGDLDAWRTRGGHRRISRESVDRWIAARQAQGAAGAPRPGRPQAPGAQAGSATPRRSPVPRAPRAQRVLLIEDSVHYQTLMSMLLRQQFPEVEFHLASDGIAGLAMAGQWQPDVLIVDILLPGIDGATLITSLRSHPQFSESRLIVVTSLDDAQRAPYAFALQNVPIVHKPRLVAELPAMLRRSLEERGRAAARAAKRSP